MASRCYESHEALRKRHRLALDRRIFVCKGERLASVRSALLERGWFENTHSDTYFSRFFDLKWATKRADAEEDFGNVPCTQLLNHFPKRGGVQLGCKTALLRNLQNYCLERRDQLATIMPRTYALSSLDDLRSFIRDFAVTRAEGILQSYVTDGLNESNAAAVAVASKIMQRSCDPRHEQLPVVRSRDEWTYLLTRSSLPLCLHRSSNATGFDADSDVSGDTSTPTLEIAEVMELLERLPLEHQQTINGTGSLWVLKAPHLSRGRGIRVFADLVQILDEAYTQNWRVCVQKYVECPLILDGFKCDVRVWALVASWAPRCVVFVHDEPYLMRSTTPFTIATSSLDEDSVHLCNIGDDVFLSALFNNSPALEERWKAFTWDRICQSISAAVLSVADAAMVHAVPPHKGPSSFELFGFDFAMTRDLEPWLLEANTSPDMGEQSGPRMQAYVRKAVDGMLDIVLGLHEHTLQMPPVGDCVGAWQLLVDSQLDPVEARRRFYAKGLGPPSGACSHNHIDVVRQSLFLGSSSTRHRHRSLSASTPAPHRVRAQSTTVDRNQGVLPSVDCTARHLTHPVLRKSRRQSFSPQLHSAMDATCVQAGLSPMDKARR